MAADVKEVETATAADVDARIAERVMGWTVVHAAGEPDWFDAIPADKFPVFAVWPEGGTAWYESPHDIDSRDFRPRESIEAAMQVVEKLNPDFSFSCASIGPTGELWQAVFTNREKRSQREPGSEFDAIAPTLPEAICRAALRAVEAKEK